MKSQYIDAKAILFPEDKPLLLIPYYQLNFAHFLTPDSPATGQSTMYQLTSATFHPAASIIAFQNSILVGSQCGRVLKFNSNIALDTYTHNDKDKVYGTLYGKILTEYDQPLQN